MITFTSIDLQKHTGDIQRSAAEGPVAITSHGKPRNVMLSAAEFCRLKRAAGEAVPPDLLPKRAVTLHHADDPLGYDVSDLPAAARRMAEDVRSGRTEQAVQSELAAVRARFRKGPSGDR